MLPRPVNVRDGVTSFMDVFMLSMILACLEDIAFKSVMFTEAMAFKPKGVVIGFLVYAALSWPKEGNSRPFQSEAS